MKYLLILFILFVHYEIQANELHGNRTSFIFHKPDCRYYECRNCVKVFKNPEEAAEAGYVPCKICGKQFYKKNPEDSAGKDEEKIIKKR